MGEPTKLKPRRCVRNRTSTDAVEKKLYAKSGDTTMLIGLFPSINRANAAASMIKDTIEAYNGKCKITFIVSKQ